MNSLAFVYSRSPWTRALGLARSVLAMTTALVLLETPTSSLFLAAAGAEHAPYCSAASRAGAFCLFSGHLSTVQYVGAIGLIIVATGYRPRLTGLLHWYITWSVFVAIVPQDGGDQVAAVLTLLLLPVVLTDPRRWHWEAPPSSVDDRRLSYRLARIGAVAVVLQVAFIYADAGLAKFGVRDWANGTTMFYVLEDPVFGLPSSLRSIAEPFLTDNLFVSLLTWSVLVLESSLGLALLLPTSWRRPLSGLGMSMHCGIAIFMGLWSFGPIMCAALLLYLGSPFSPSGPSADSHAPVDAPYVGGRADGEENVDGLLPEQASRQAPVAEHA